MPMLSLTFYLLFPVLQEKNHFSHLKQVSSSILLAFKIRGQGDDPLSEDTQEIDEDMPIQPMLSPHSLL